jgi:hypothetical protein
MQLLDELTTTMRTLAPQRTQKSNHHKPPSNKHSHKTPYTDRLTEQARITLDKLNKLLHQIQQSPIPHPTHSITDIHTKIRQAQQQYKFHLTRLYTQWSNNIRTQLTTLRHGGGGIPAAREGLGMGHHWSTMVKTLSKGETHRPTPDRPPDTELINYFTHVFQPNTITSSSSSNRPSLYTAHLDAHPTHTPTHHRKNGHRRILQTTIQKRLRPRWHVRRGTQSTFLM